MGESKSKRTLAHIIIVGLFAALLFCTSCQKYNKKDTMRGEPAKQIGVPRISPAYIQWLRQQSMLGWAQTLIPQVSGTSRIWNSSGTEERYPLLLKETPSWLFIDPKNWNDGRTHKEFANKENLTRYINNGILGLYISPISETAEIWEEDTHDPEGSQVTGFALRSSMGNEKDFDAFLKKVSQLGIQIGGTLICAATGIGPDFMLQARGLEEYEGLYAFIEIPKKLWSLLPKAKSEWHVQKLSQEAFLELAEQGFLPRKLHKNALAWTNPSGWAATGIIQGVDGNTHRYLYAFDTNIHRPVLFWQDPSGLARRIFAAACIRHTGLQQQTLAGLALKPLIGLDAYREGEQSQDATSHLEPYLSALSDLGQTVHRYGGWTTTTDTLPLDIAQHVLKRTDFFFDAHLMETITYALAHENTDPLQQHLVKLKTLPVKRFSKGYISSQPYGKQRDALITYAIPLALPGLFFLPESHIHSDTQEHLEFLLRTRKKLRAAEGSLEYITTKDKSCLLIVNKLPSNALWLTVVNFSHKEKSIPIPDICKSSKIQELTPINASKEMTNEITHRILTLKPRQARHFLTVSR